MVKFSHLKTFLNFFSLKQKIQKNLFILFIGVFNLNLHDHDTRKKVIAFLTLMYENVMITTLNKPIRVGKMTATVIDRNFKTTIIKSDHFPICFIIPSLKHQGKLPIYLRE